MTALHEPPEYKYIAYIDESGDPGIKRVKPLDKPGSSEWLVLGATVVAAEREEEIAVWNAELMAKMRSHQMRDLHFQRLSPAKKLIACEHVASLPVRCFVVASNKQNMRGYSNPRAAQIPSNNWFYCWMTRVVLERITHWVKAHSVKEYGSPKLVKLVFSGRGGLRYSQMKAYFEWLRFQGRNPYLPLGVIEHDVLDIRLMEVRNHVGHDGLKLPDIVASAFFKAIDIWDTGASDPQFAEALRPRMARWPDTDGGQFSGYGVKLWPGYGKLRDKVLPEQLATFKSYGYPKQWWQRGGP